MSGFTTIPVYTCEKCLKSYSLKSSLIRHQKACLNGKKQNTYVCEKCSKEFNRKHSLKLHQLVYHDNDRSKLKCLKCANTLPNYQKYKDHVLKCQVGVGPKTQFTCKKCKKTLSSINEYIPHSRYCSFRNEVKRKKKNQDNLKEMSPTATAIEEFTCKKCKKVFSTLNEFIPHSRYCAHKGGGKRKKKNNIAKSSKKGKRKFKSRTASNSAKTGLVKEFDFLPEGDDGIDLMYFMVKYQSDVVDVLQSEINEKKAIKWALSIHVRYGKTSADGVTSYTEPYFNTRMTAATQADDLEYFYIQATNVLFRKMDNYEGDSSNLNLEAVISLKLSVCKFQPFKGSSFLPLPDELSKKRSILNIRNLTDDLCFVYAILAHLHPSSNPWKDLPTEYEPYIDELDLNGFQFPMRIKDISRFERVNRLYINVYSYEDKTLFPLRISDNKCVRDESRHINLLLLTADLDGEVDDQVDDFDDIREMPVENHYCLITNMSGVLHKKKGDHRKYVCEKCLWSYSSKQRLEDHYPYCYEKAQTVKMPEKDKAIRNFGLGKLGKTVQLPFVVYADFETVLEPVPLAEAGDGTTRRIQKHIPCAYAYKIVSRVEKYTQPLKVYSGEDAALDFIESILSDYERMKEILNNPIEMKLTNEDEEYIQSATTCYLCNKQITVNEKKVLDHDHLTGKFRGVCHDACNVNYKESHQIPVVLHNASRYDNKLILQAAEKFLDRKLNCIPQNTEHFLMFSIDDLIFLDSYKFLQAPLQTLVDNLCKKGQDKFKHLSSHFTEHVELLTRKLPFFYDYVDSFGKLEETKCPDRKDFYSKLTEETISEKEHEFVKGLWDIFDIKSIREFMHLYVSVDCLVLADVMEEFRSLIREYYQLECFAYFSLPGLASDACLKMTGVKLDLITDIDQYLMIEGAVRGGVSTISHRYAAANNKYMDDYDESLPESYLLYFDVNNLYGTAMSMMLPRGNFTFLTKEQINAIDWSSVDTEANIGYVLEIDLIYPQKLHRLHASMPVAPMKESIPYDECSPYYKRLLKEMGIEDEKPTGLKLLATLKDKRNYVVHFATLKYYIHLGLKVDKIHRVLSFEQSKWMKPFVDFNTARRKEATDDFSKDLWKLCTNANYGKHLMNVRKHERVVLVTNKEKLARYVSKPNFRLFKIFSEDLVAVKLDKVSVSLNQPISVGFTILEHAKRILFSFHYDVMLRKYGDKLKLLLTDTDSVFYQLTGGLTDKKPLTDPYRFIEKNLHIFDTSNFPVGHKLHSMKGHKELGLLKDEASGKIIVEFVGIRSKNYSFITEKKPGVLVEKKRAKGVKKTYVKKHLSHELYKECLFNKKKVMARFHLIRSFSNQLYTIRCDKVAMSPLDDKRYLLDDGITSVPYGYQG